MAAPLRARRRRLAPLAGLALPLLLASCTRPPDAVLGTWELNLAKSSYSPGLPPKSQTRRFEVSGKGVRTVIDGVNSVGKPTHVEYTASYDGKDYPITGTPVGDTIALKRIDARRTETTQKKAGRITLMTTWLVSEDGKTLTVSVTGADVNGDAVHNVLLFDRK